MLKLLASVCAAALSATSTLDDSKNTNTFLGKTLGSHMVLQRDAAATLYGYSAAAGAAVTVSFGDLRVRTSSGSEQAADGGFRWVATLPPVAGGFTAYTMNVTSSAGEQALLTDVLFGDVYMCSGQSNMQFSVPGDFDWEAEIAAADNYPYVRIMSVGQGYDLPQATEPLEDLYFLDMPWAVGSSLSVTTEDNNWAYRYSAVCWFFGKDIFDTSLERAVPVGLVSDNWGGTIVEAWAPPPVMEKCDAAVAIIDADRAKSPDYEPRGMAAGEDFDPNAHSVLYNTMIYPFRDMVIKGALWYQGESNCAYADTYPCLQDAMVKSWRELFGVNFAFLFVQLSTWNNGGNGVLANFRFAQFSILSMTENVAMITAADLGDPESTYDPIHPRNKTEVGRRLALAASSLIYGAPDIPYLGPLVESVTAVDNSDFGWTVRVTFTPASCGQGLRLQAAQECPADVYATPGGCGKILLADVEAIATVSGSNSIDFIPTEKMTVKPTSLSYCLGDYPLMTVYNSFGIPTIPFYVDVPV
jgi:sialate O-acetylesterase